MSTWGQSLSGRSRYADVALGAVVLGIVALMIVPIPTALLDVLLAANLALSTVLLLVSMSLRDGLSFAAMPTVLLVTTLFRLSLNVSSTRLILLQADAGRVIEAFGDFVVRGNYAVGGVVFLVLTLIQYVVVARGAERVAEVGARFTLDAMPGRQLAIDSDLRSGALAVDEARARRRALDRESQLYGAMDGAMKFVKGDAIAGIVITVINLVAGLGIGVLSRDLTVTESLRVYGLLTIGDGLVCQIPSLLTATSAGLVVTRVASADAGASLGDEVARQLFGDRRVLQMGAAFVALLALVPGLPAFPFALLACVLGAASYGLGRASARARLGTRPGATDERQPFAPFGVTLSPALGARLLGEDAALPRALEDQSRALADRLGVRLPEVALRVDPALPEHAYVLLVGEVPREQAELAAGSSDARAVAERLATRLAALALGSPRELLGLAQTQHLLDALEAREPALVRAAVPKPVSLALLCEVLRRLLAEGVTLRPLAAILETLVRQAGPEASAAQLTAQVRVRLASQISHAHAPHGKLRAQRLEALIEDALREVPAAGDDAPALPPEQARDVVEAVRRATLSEGRARGVILCATATRRPLRALIEGELPEVAVLAFDELTPEVIVELGPEVRLAREA